MAYPSVHKFATVHISGYCSSIGGTPVSTYIRVPFRARLSLVDGVTYGTITTADCALAVALNGTSVTMGTTFSFPVAAAAAGQVASAAPASPTHCNADDVIKITPSLASGASIAANFTIALTPE